MRLVSLLSTIMLFAGLPNAGDIKLSGTVKDADGQAVAGAHVSLKHFPRLRVRTDESGAFLLTGTSAGSFSSDTITAVARGFRSGIIAVSSYENNDIAFVLTKSNTWKPVGDLQHKGNMVLIKAKGYDFEMGQPNDTIRGLYFDEPTTGLEQPVHTVKFTYDFWMDTTEVTQLEYDSLMRQVYGDKYVKANWNASNGLGNKWAAYSVDYGSAQLFCNARSKSQGLSDTAYSYSGIIGSIGAVCTLKNVTLNLQADAYRLPTEAEWEYACRGGTTTDFYWGKNFESYLRTKEDSIEVGQYAVLDLNSFALGKEKIIRLENGDSSYYGTHEVAKKKPNAYGLYDMSGNVSEWCHDWLEYYAWGEGIDPTGSVPVSTVGYDHVRRGGNWSNNISFIRSSERDFDAFDYEFLFCGLRAARTVVSNSSVLKVIKKVSGATPSISLISGAIHCSNVNGRTISLHTVQGRRIGQFRSQGNTITITTDNLVSGTYIVTAGEPVLASKIISVLR